jgi:hypothetical protein
MAYIYAKRIILRGGYDPADMALKLTTFKEAGKLTQEQYDELTALMGGTTNE